MNIFNLLVNIAVAVILVLVAFWALGLLVGLIPAIIVTLLKVLVVLLAIGWVLGYIGTPITFNR